MFGSTGAGERSYADAAITVALFKALVAKGVLSEPDVSSILTEAQATLRSAGPAGDLVKAVAVVNDLRSLILPI